MQFARDPRNLSITTLPRVKPKTNSNWISQGRIPVAMPARSRCSCFLTSRRAHLLGILLIDTHTGMRRTEPLSLHRSPVDLADLARGTITLLRAKNGKQRVVLASEYLISADECRMSWTLIAPSGANSEDPAESIFVSVPLYPRRRRSFILAL